MARTFDVFFDLRLNRQAITWANVDSAPGRLMASLGHNELNHTDRQYNHKLDSFIVTCIFVFYIILSVPTLFIQYIDPYPSGLFHYF